MLPCARRGFQSSPKRAALTPVPKPPPGGEREYLGRAEGGKKRDARESESWQAQKTGAWRSFVQGHWLSPDSVFPALAFQLPWLH